jgi:hypothetical protein
VNTSTTFQETYIEQLAALPDLRKQGLAALLERDPEGWSCLQGLLAMMRLPATDESRQHLEIYRGSELGWMQVDRITINPDVIAYAKGHNGHSEVYSVHAGTSIPAWKVCPGPGMLRSNFI